jgi:hypothetical protein
VRVLVGGLLEARLVEVRVLVGVTRVLVLVFVLDVLVLVFGVQVLVRSAVVAVFVTVRSVGHRVPPPGRLTRTVRPSPR